MSYSAVSERFRAKSEALLLSLERRLDDIVIAWLMIAGLAVTVRLAAGPVPTAPLEFGSVTPYLLLVLAPAASIVLALRWIPDGSSTPQPATRLAVMGKWRSVCAAEARRHRLYGTSGLMVSLLIGMLLNVPVRAIEYLGAIPAISAAAPPWLATLHVAMTFDVVAFTSLYAIAFVAAFRRAPLFPRLLVAIWMFDVLAQVVIAHVVAGSGIPAEVAGALHPLLDGNIKKVLISASLWLPYLLVSTRVNVTYRHRVPA